eukprot:9706070-Lingulodinium_polyedra.AAC.1
MGMRRWFSCQAVQLFHNSLRHRRFMAIARVGLRVGVRRFYEDCPFWGLPSRRRGQPQDAGAPQGQQKEQLASKGQAVAATVAAKAKGVAA